MAYKQNPGLGPKMKTGGGVPSALLQEGPTDPVKKKTDEKTGAKPSFPGVTWTRPAYQTQPNTYSRIQEDAAIKSDSILSSIHEKKALASGKLPEGAKPYQPRGTYKGHKGKTYSTNINSETGATTFGFGRSDQRLTIPRGELMTRVARGSLNDLLLGSFKDNGSLKKK